MFFSILAPYHKPLHDLASYKKKHKNKQNWSGIKSLI